MASTIKIKRSNVAGKKPTTSDIATGELALNTKDFKLFSSNGTTIFELANAGALANTNAYIATRAPIASPTFTGTASAPVLASTQSSGDEGGQLDLALAATNTTLTGGIAIDVYQNRLRIFETGGTNRGAYIDLSAATAGVGSNLLSGGGGGSSNSFTGILVGSNVVVADSVTDRLTFVAGSGMQIAADPTSDTITFVSTGSGATWAALTSTNTALRLLIDDRLQVANAAATYQTIAIERAALANTNLFIRTQLANTNAYIATKTDYNTFNNTLANTNGFIKAQLANTNAYIATRAPWSALTSTNTALRTLISDRLQVANAVATYQTIAIERAALANTNAYIATKITNSVSTTIQTRSIIPETDVTYDLGSPTRRFKTLYISGNTISLGTANLSSTGSTLQVGGQTLATNAYVTSTFIANTTARGLINDRYQVANVNSNFLKKTGTVPQTVTPLTTFSANVSIEGKLFVTGGVETYTANNLVISDNMIYLNSGVSSNPDLGIAANYNDGTYHHTGFFRDASDAGTWKVFENYAPEPDANVFINTAHATFRLAPFAAMNIRVARNLTVVANSNLGNTSVTGFLKLNSTDIRSTFAQNTYVNTLLANTNAYIATRASWSSLTSTNTSLRTLINDRLQVANAAATYVVKDRVVSYAAANSITLNSANTDVAKLTYTGAAGGFAINAPSGSPTDAQKILFRLNTTNQMSFVWNAIFRGSTDLPLPATSSGSSKTDYLAFVYNSDSTKWDLIAKNFGF